MASRVLGIPCSKIHISETSTNTVPNTSPTAASASSDLNGAAVQNACEILVNRLEPYKAQNPKGSWESWVSRNNRNIHRKSVAFVFWLFQVDGSVSGDSSVLRQSQSQRQRVLQVSRLSV